MRIKKISPTTPANGNIENQYGTSQTNAYSQAYINNATAPNSTKWNNLINDKATENNTDTWISVLKDDKLQHTTISSIISRGIVSNNNTTTGVTYFTAGNLKIVLATIPYKTGTTAPYYVQWSFTSPISFTKAYAFCGAASGNMQRTIQIRANASSFSGTSVGGIVISDIASYENDFSLMLIGI